MTILSRAVDQVPGQSPPQLEVADGTSFYTVYFASLVNFVFSFSFVSSIKIFQNSKSVNSHYLKLKKTAV
jgi:hypothetical protein